MRTRTAMTVLVLAAIAGCIANPRGLPIGSRGIPGPVEAVYAAPELGLVTDGKLRVVDMEPLGAAAQAGVQIGDILIAIAPAPPLPPGAEPTPYDLGSDVVVIEVDEEGRPLGTRTPIPGVAQPAPPGTPAPLATATPVPTLDPVAAPTATAAAATAVIESATAGAQATVADAPPQSLSPLSPAELEATVVASEAIYEAQVAQEAYQECIAAANDPTLPERWCPPPGLEGAELLTGTVPFSETARAKYLIHYGPDRMMLKVLRDGQELEILVVPGPRPASRPGRAPEATLTPVWPPYDYF